MVNDHDFIGNQDKEVLYGILDIGANRIYVSVSISAETAQFAVNSIGHNSCAWAGNAIRMPERL